MTNHIKFSLILISFNQKFFIERTILSLINQEYQNKEIIVIDGNSTDGSLEIIAQYSNYFSKVIIEKDYGLYHARNKGILEATGDYIYFIGSDDILVENALQIVASAVQNDFPDIIYGECKGLDLYDNILHKYYWKNVDLTNKKKYFNRMTTIPDQATFYKKSAFSITGIYNLKYRYGGDTELRCRFIDCELKIKASNKILGYWRINQDSITYSNKGRFQKIFEAIRINYKYSRNMFSKYNFLLIMGNLKDYFLKSLIYKMRTKI